MGAAPKAKGPASDSFMTADKMKPLLALSKREPVQAAIGLTADGEGIILLDKKKRPKGVLSAMKADAAKAKIQLNNGSLRFGRAEVDTDYDSGMVRFFINKDAPGTMRVKLIEVVKRIPYQKVEINVDPSLEEEQEEDLDVLGGETAEAEAEDAPALVTPQQTQAASGPDPHVLTAELGALARRIPEVPNTDPALKARLVKFATDANAAIKGNDPTAAAAFIVELRGGLHDALDAAGAGIGQMTPNGQDQSPQAEAHPAFLPLTAELGALAHRIAAVSGADAGLRGSLAKLATEVQAAIKGNDIAAASGAMAQLREAIESAGARGETLGPALAAWKTEREKALTGLNAIIAEVSGMDFVDAPEAVILLRSIAANLTEEPATRQQVDELRRYLEDDENVEEAEEPNGFGIELALREPLLAALAGINSSLPA